MRRPIAAALLVCLLIAASLAGAERIAWGQPPAAPPAPRQPAEQTDRLPNLPTAQVSIPWTELRTLLGDPAARQAPPTPYVFQSAQCAATVDAQSSRLQAVITVEATLLGDGWTLVPLGPADAGVTSVTADGKACPLVVKEEQLQALLQGAGPRRLSISLEQPIRQAEGGETVELPLPPAPLVQLTLTIDAARQVVTASGAAGAATKQLDGKTVYTASVRGGRTTLAWRREPAEGLASRLYAQGGTLGVVDPALSRFTTLAEVQIAQRPTQQLRWQLPQGAVVLGVAGKQVAGWSIAPAPDAQLLLVQLTEPTLGAASLAIDWETSVPKTGDLTIELPTLLDALRQTGHLAIAAGEGARLDPQQSEMTRLGVSELPAELRGVKREGIAEANPQPRFRHAGFQESGLREGSHPQVELGYRYLALPAAVLLKVSRPVAPAPRRLVQTNTLVRVESRQLACTALLNYEILHAGVETLRVRLPAEVELVSVVGDSLRAQRVVTEEERRVLVVDLKDLVRGEYTLSVRYRAPVEKAAQPAAEAPAAKGPVNVPLLTPLDAEESPGTVGVELADNVELQPAVTGLERIDVRELPDGLWRQAASPVVLGYRYAAAAPALSLAITRHEDLDVLVAMSDICEAATVVTADGKRITKLMFIVRNNLKPFMTVKLPAGAEVWSALVDDRPVTPARNGAGEVLVPLKKSEEVEDEDDESYRARRERRRRGNEDRHEARLVERLQRLDEQPRDLRPYDVELVFVESAPPPEETGSLKLALPSVDIPTGQLSWAILLPNGLRLVDVEGNMAEVPRFTLPFAHFADEALSLRSAEQLQKAQEQLAQLADAQQELAQAIAEEKAKAAGVLPVRVEIPLTGTPHRFEKFLVTQEMPQVELIYRRRSE